MLSASIVNSNTLRRFGLLERMGDNKITRRILKLGIATELEGRVLEYVRVNGLEYVRMRCMERCKWRHFAVAHPQENSKEHSLLYARLDHCYLGDFRHCKQIQQAQMPNVIFERENEVTHFARKENMNWKLWECTVC